MSPRPEEEDSCEVKLFFRPHDSEKDDTKDEVDEKNQILDVIGSKDLNFRRSKNGQSEGI